MQKWSIKTNWEKRAILAALPAIFTEINVLGRLSIKCGRLMASIQRHKAKTYVMETL